MNRQELEEYLDNSERYYNELKEEMKKDWKRRVTDEGNNLPSRTDFS